MNEKTRSVLMSPWTYFAATYAWTWLIWGIVLAQGLTMESGLGLGLLLLGVMGPMVIDLVVTYLTQNKEGRRDYWKRVLSFRRIPAKWYLVIFLFVPVLHVIAALLDIATGGTGATWGEAALNFIPNPLSVIPSILFASLIPFVEELGWRGYVLDRLQERYNALTSSLIVGVVWSLWHLPLFLVKGTYQAGLGFGSWAFWLFIFGVVPLSIPFSWIYNNTRRSTLAVILFHSMVNFTGEVIALTEGADTFAIGLWVVAAVGITAIWGAKSFMGEKDLPRFDWAIKVDRVEQAAVPAEAR
jgi:membrane protease YdiL (CAAX protease family)